MASPIISLCLPTNGIIEWVFPVLDSIYSQNVDNSLFEVIVTNNGKNNEFHKLMTKYSTKYPNLIYKKTTAFMFDNQLEALKLAKGRFFKFVNHRGIFTEGSLLYLINVIKENSKSKPVIYFSCGALEQSEYKLNNFDDFVKTLRRFASWTTGVGIWKDDFKKIPKDKKFDRISPHSGILFSERNKNNYLIDNFLFSKDIVTDHSKKGTYDLFKAFAVEELAITQNLYIDGDITADTLKIVKRDYKKFVSELYFDFCLTKKPCSYQLDGFNDAMGIYFSKVEIITGAFVVGFRRLLSKIKRVFVKGK